ncbi:hypothetical protein NP493_253g03029 [Ridgeia piscesae]|uniref:phosphatidylinositol-3,5-bisphosphate 3-phosphatase n=1 Tax=Ridgeia piscesae TaxID=27915 RepID=A0AAD9NYI3_RIDPI|nr:hypothetical protein NP493_253g03029 [Ridgeia piscesae]
MQCVVAALCRCSQPLAGFSARCVEDEQMLQAIRRANPSSKFMFVIDTRPKINAMVNRAAGKGYENESFYSNIKFQFFGIENIHVMRSSLQKLLEVCELKNPSMSAFLTGIENSGWLKHIKSIMDTSVFISKAIEQGISVLVHCSDGWDRTAQTCSLASLLLDPYYRRIEGFQTLIEKEWLSFGHKFIDRCGFLGTVDTREVSPVFTQFLDCVWQLLQQFPRSFEFNEQFLHMLHDHVFSCQFGTFIGNCEKDRIDLRLHERTYSLWAHLTKYTSDFLNPFYQRDLELTQPVLQPVTNPQSFRFWRGLYCRFDSGIHPRESVYDVVRALKDHTSSLQDHCQLLEKRIASLCKLLGRGEDQLQMAMQNLSSSESMDFRALLLNESRKATEDEGGNQPPLVGKRGRCESDAESGFEDGGSSLTSKSMNDVTLGPLDMDNLQIYHLLMELQSVAVEWKSFRKVQNCSCAMPFEHFTKKYHCWSCGDIYCTRCIDRMMALPGHLSQQAVHVCKACYKDMKQSPSASVNDLQKLQQQTATHSNTARTTSVNSV